MILKEKIALITGASKGIGRAIAEKFLKKNIKIIGTSRNLNGVNIINNYLSVYGKGFMLDVSDKQSIKNVLKKIKDEFGDIDILINNAGITNDNLLIRMKDNDWKEILKINLYSIFYLSKIIIKSMIKKRNGRIISIGSVVANMGNAGQTNYAAAKAGLIGFTKSLSREVASRGITVNIVSPGFIKTKMIEKLNKKQRDNILSNIPIGRFGNTQEVANVVAFLASEEASYITGATIHVNGGLYMM